MPATEPPAVILRYRVKNSAAEDHGWIGVVVGILDTQDDPDLRRRLLVLDFGDGRETPFFRDELERRFHV